MNQYHMNYLDLKYNHRSSIFLYKIMQGKHIKNIIFDYGNVIFEIDFKRTQEALSQLGITNSTEFFAHKSHHNLFNDFEAGSISPIQFRDGIREAAGNNNLTDEAIDAAWNSLLIGVPPGI